MVEILMQQLVMLPYIDRQKELKKIFEYNPFLYNTIVEIMKKNRITLDENS